MCMDMHHHNGLYAHAGPTLRVAGVGARLVPPLRGGGGANIYIYIYIYSVIDIPKISFYTIHKCIFLSKYRKFGNVE